MHPATYLEDIRDISSGQSGPNAILNTYFYLGASLLITGSVTSHIQYMMTKYSKRKLHFYFVT